jgi:hypothetical protein
MKKMGNGDWKEDWRAPATPNKITVQMREQARDVIVLADGDDASEVAARACAWRWKREGRRVRIARPPQGTDFNDVLMGRVPAQSGA